MERVTYPDKEVKAVIDASYLRMVFDRVEDEEETDMLDIIGIPVAIVFDANGKELGRYINFQQPDEYAVALQSHVEG